MQALIADGSYKQILKVGRRRTARSRLRRSTRAVTQDAVRTQATRGRPEPIQAVPVRHPGRWVAVVVLAVLAAMFIHMLVTNDGFHWAFIVRQHVPAADHAPGCAAPSC